MRVDIRVDDMRVVGPHILVTRSDVTGSLELPNERLGAGAVRQQLTFLPWLGWRVTTDDRYAENEIERQDEPRLAVNSTSNAVNYHRLTLRRRDVAVSVSIDERFFFYSIYFVIERVGRKRIDLRFCCYGFLN